MSTARKLIVVIAQSFLLSFVSSRDIYVSKTGSLQASCGSYAQPCKTVDFALNISTSNTRIILRKGSYTLQRSHTFSSVNNLKIVGEDQVRITCHSDVSISFLLSKSIGLYNLTFRECSGWQKTFTGKMQVMEYLTALYFSYCNDIQIQNVQVSGSVGVGLTLTDVSGTVNISNSLFKDNTPEQNTSSKAKGNNDKTDAGGGVFFLLNSYGYNPLKISKKEHEKYQHNGRVVLNNVQFVGNEARSPDTDYRNDSHLTPFSRGGGLGIYLFGNASGNAFQLSRCSFIGNRARWGGGVQAEFKHETESNIIDFKECIFRENYAHYAGGGARIGDFVISDKTLIPNKFTITDCQFHNNTSIWGGGLSVYGTAFLEKFPSQPGVREKFLITKTSFSENNGNIGSALGVFLFNLNDDNIGPLVPIHVVLENCTITNNHVLTIKHEILTGQGAVYTVEVPVISRGYLLIANNTHTSMVLDSAILVIHGKVDFLYNIGYRGGALALYGNSKIRLAPKSKLYFIGNKCFEKGGAIYAVAPGSPQVSFNATGYATHQCFFEYMDQQKADERDLDFDLWETEIVFQANESPNEESGLSVYATSLQNCRRVGETRWNNTVLKWKFIKFLEPNGVNVSTIDREVSTDPVEMRYNKTEWFVAPSATFDASISLLDEIGNPVYGIINIDIHNNDLTSRARLGASSSLFLVRGKQVRFLKLMGQKGDNFDVVIRSVGRYILRARITNITLNDCTPGFHSNDDQCVCSDSKQPGVSRCSENRQTVFLKSGYWAGMVGDKFYTVPCPVNYCQCPNPYSENAIGECSFVENEMCAGDRDQSSVLCGKCKPGYTASFGSEACIPNCSSTNVFYFLLYGLLLIIVVMVLLTIDLNVFTGYLNAWLYSYQIIAYLTPGSFEFDDFMEFVIGIANLQLRVNDTGTCFFNNLDEADQLCIMYVLPVFLIIVVGCIAKLVKRFPDCCYSRKVSPFSGLAIIFVLCYTNITGISLKILNPSMFKIDSKTRMMAQGELQIFSGKHIVYGIVACVFLFLIAMVTLLLMFQPYVAECLRIVSTNYGLRDRPGDVKLQNVKPIFDKLQGCFKDEYRWCAAFYFLARFVILILVNFVPQSSFKQALLQGTCVVVLVVFLWLRPYKEANEPKETNYSWINKFDAALLTNLTLVAIFSSAVDENSESYSEVKVFVEILAYVPLIVLLFILLCWFNDRLKRRCNCCGTDNPDASEQETAPLKRQTDYESLTNSMDSSGITTPATTA